MIAKELDRAHHSQPPVPVDTKRPDRRRTATPLTLGFLASLIAMAALVAPTAMAVKGGDRDVSFGNSGTVIQDVFGGWNDHGSALAIQGDGKIVVAGKWGFGGGYGGFGKGYFALLRFNADGSLDTSFGAGGRVATSFTGNSSSAAAVAIQRDGRIVVAGADQDSHDFAVARYRSDGSLDTSFSSDGKLTTGNGGYERAEAVAIQADGRIVVAGTTTYPDSDNFFLVRYRSDGSLDEDFDDDGKLVTGIGAQERAHAVAIQGDGKIVVVGERYDCDCGFFGSGQEIDFALARYHHADGSLDQSFDDDGKVTTDFDGDEEANAVAIQADGKIVAAGGKRGENDKFVLARYHPADGSLDDSFDDDGKVGTDFGNVDYATAVAIQGDGKIVAAGSGEGREVFALARFNHMDASLDTSFSGDGKQTTILGGYEFASAVAIQADGKIVAAGVHDDDNIDYVRGIHDDDNVDFAQDFALVRYHASDNAIIGDTPIIRSGPSAETTDSAPTFAFESPETGASFGCRLDGADWRSCSSPHTTAPLADGAHTIEVRAIDPSNPTSPTRVERSFRVDTAAASLALAGKRRQQVGRVVRVTALCRDEACAAIARGTLVAGRKRIRLTRRTRYLRAGEKGALDLRLPTGVRKGAKRALAAGKRALVKISVRAVDVVGHDTRAKRTVTLKLSTRR
jgi:uncharacterized delta-60 repeat protein